MRHPTPRAARLTAVCAALLTCAALLIAATPATATARKPKPVSSVATYTGLTASQRTQLLAIARDTWNFYRADVDPHTGLPLDNLTYAGGAAAPTDYGRYTSAANIGVYLWAVVAASDLHLVSRRSADAMVTKTLRTVSSMARYKGFLYQWYDTTTAQPLTNPGAAACTAEGGTFDNCSFLSNVDNGWYASGLIEVRQAFPELGRLANSLIAPMDFSLFYDDRAETHCNVNPAIAGNQPTGQMYGGYYAGLPPTDPANAPHYYHNGALYSDPRISAYLGLGLHQMPGNVWWRSWRELPPQAPFADCTTDPDFSWQGQWPMSGTWVTQKDPQSGKTFTVWEGHYTYPGSDLKFIPTYGGGMFEGLMANDVVPETSWGPQSFGRADYATAQVQITYATAEAEAAGLGDVAVEHGRRHRRLQRIRRVGSGLPVLRSRGDGRPPERPAGPVRHLRNRGRGHAARIVPRARRRPATGVREHPEAAAALSGRVRRRRILRRGQPDHRSRRAPLPGPRPVDDHGLAGQRSRQPRDAASLRRRPGVEDGPRLPGFGGHVPLILQRRPDE